MSRNRSINSGWISGLAKDDKACNGRGLDSKTNLVESMSSWLMLKLDLEYLRSSLDGNAHFFKIRIYFRGFYPEPVSTSKMSIRSNLNR